MKRCMYSMYHVFFLLQMRKNFIKYSFVLVVSHTYPLMMIQSSIFANLNHIFLRFHLALLSFLLLYFTYVSVIRIVVLLHMFTCSSPLPCINFPQLYLASKWHRKKVSFLPPSSWLTPLLSSFNLFSTLSHQTQFHRQYSIAVRDRRRRLNRVKQKTRERERDETRKMKMKIYFPPSTHFQQQQRTLKFLLHVQPWEHFRYCSSC